MTTVSDEQLRALMRHVSWAASGPDWATPWVLRPSRRGQRRWHRMRWRNADHTDLEIRYGPILNGRTS